MRTSTVSAAFLLIGAGAAALAAAEPGGNNIVLNGSDTLFDVTQAVIDACKIPPTSGGHGFSDFAANGDTYAGGGSGVGAGQMGLGLQELAPMSRALKNTEYCAPGTVAAGLGASPANTAALLVGIDGVAIVANSTSSCASVTNNTANNFATQTSFAVTGSCPSCDANGNYTLGDAAGTIYQNQPSFDALSIIYFGLTHDNHWDCAGNVRKSLIKQWGALFGANCTNCATGLTHAWRRSDLSGTTDAFVSVLLPSGTFTNGTATNGKGAFETDAAGNPFTTTNAGCKDANGNATPCAISIGIGTLSTVPTGKARKSNPFCNSSDAAQANPNAVPPVSAAMSFGGSSDFQDLDPVRTNCVTKDGVCEALRTPPGTVNFSGDLGVVLPILLPDSAATVFSDDYPAPNCGGGCALIAVAKTSLVPSTYRCPSGGKPFAGNCYMPVVSGSSPPDPRCVAATTAACIDVSGHPDGRVYNMVTVMESANAGTKSAGGTYQFGFDANNRFLNASFYRVRSTSKADPNKAAGFGICQQNDDTSQIGCLVDSDPCSIGYAGRESAHTYPDPGIGAVASAPLKALAVNGTPPFAPGSDADAYLENLVQSTGTVYPLARRLYVSTLYGFNNLQGGELELAKCYANNAITTSAISGNGFVPVPAVGSTPAGVKCIDYIENRSTTSSPPPNVQGSGAVALPGCGSSVTTTNDACTGFTDSEGNAVPESL